MQPLRSAADPNDEVAKLSAMQPGSGRNQGLNNAALRLGEMVVTGWIDRSEVENALWEAARANGYRSKDGDKAAWATLQSGLTAGMKSPRPPLAEKDPPPRTSFTVNDASFSLASPAYKVDNRVAPLIASAASLRTKVFNPIRYIVPGCLAEGCTIVAGRPPTWCARNRRSRMPARAHR
jgi:hypothetical protein